MLNKLRVSTKIIIPIIIILTIGNVITNYVTTLQMNKLVKNSAEESLSMLTDSIFLTLKNAMNTGDPAIIKHAEEQSGKEIKGLSKLTVAKSKETIEMYSPNSSFTNDKIIIDVFNKKKEQVVDFYKDDSHFLRVLRPMIATDECLACHANQKNGDVIGVIDLTFSIDKADETIFDTITFIIGISLAFIVLTILVVLVVSKKATEPLKGLKEELSIFFSFLANERDTIEPFKVHYMDEIGEMTVSLNENIAKTIEGINKDTQAIEQSALICKKAALGDVNVKIDAIASNPAINNLTQIVNDLLSSLTYNINRALDTLNNYSNDEYSLRINSGGKTNGEILQLFNQLDYLGETLTRLSTQNLKNGKALQQTSKVFSKNVQQLATSSNSQAISLNEASEALKDVTHNIQQTTQSSKKNVKLCN